MGVVNEREFQNSNIRIFEYMTTALVRDDVRRSNCAEPVV